MRKIVIACDSYKGCLSSSDVANAAARGVAEVYPDCEVIKLAVADGGEGTVEALVDTLGGHLEWAEVSDPLGRPVKAAYGVAGDLAIIESAAACGLTLLTKEERNPLVTSTKGLEGFLEKTKGMKFTVACDVDTPYIGEHGASRVFGPQKGASEQDVEILEERLGGYALTILKETGVDVRDIAGAGAAGGLGGAFRAYLGAELKRGVDLVLDQIDFDSKIRGADLVITGEGCSDYQTLKGKTASGVLERAKRQGSPVALVSGAVRDEQMLRDGGFGIIEAVSPLSMSREEAMRPEMAKFNICQTVKRLLTNE